MPESVQLVESFEKGLCWREETVIRDATVHKSLYYRSRYTGKKKWDAISVASLFRERDVGVYSLLAREKRGSGKLLPLVAVHINPDLAYCFPDLEKIYVPCGSARVTGNGEGIKERKKEKPDIEETESENPKSFSTSRLPYS